MPDTETCPDPQNLEQLVQGRICGAAAEPLEQHLLVCRNCAERFRRLRLPSGEPATAGFVGGTVSPEAMAREARALLSPAKSPDELGWLGRYRVLKVLGAGGMGIVLEAEDTALRRPVALKVMKPALAAGGRAHQRFLQEARATAALAHDHIVTIHDVDEAPLPGVEVAAGTSVPFLAMQLLRGETLEARLQREPLLPVPEVLRLGREIVAGLAAAHQRGLIHRDIKPANVWLEAPAGRVKILDFGLVRAVGAADPATEAALPATPASSGNDERLTQEGAIIGTPAYMAPEQARNGAAVDARSDLFSLGCLLYRLCTGRVPFEGADTAATLLAVTTHQPPPPSRPGPGLPPALANLVMRLLAKRPEDRPASAGHVVEALAALERGLAERAQRRRWRALAAAAALLLVVALAVFWPRPDQEPDPGRKAPDLGPDPGRKAIAEADYASRARYPKGPPEGANVVEMINKNVQGYRDLIL